MKYINLTDTAWVNGFQGYVIYIRNQKFNSNRILVYTFRDNKKLNTINNIKDAVNIYFAW